MSDTQAQLACALTSLFGPNAPEKLGVAVSGGSDSLALMHLLAQWAAPCGVRLFVATVDHGLRPGSADEAAGVAGAARALGLAHDTLLWQGWRGQAVISSGKCGIYRLMHRRQRAGYLSQTGIAVLS